MSEVFIIGAGLSGLVAARALAQAGVAVQVFEARDRLGGRILSVTPPDGQGTFDLGPAWFWPEHSRVEQLVQELGLASFEQPESREALFDYGPGQPPARFRPDWSSPPAYRIAGGMGALVTQLAAELPGRCLKLNSPVRRVVQDGNGVTVESASGRAQAQHMIVTLPPRLAVKSLTFEPALPPELVAVMQAAQTWMGQAMKVVLAQGIAVQAVKHKRAANHLNASQIAILAEEAYEIVVYHPRLKHLGCGQQKNAAAHRWIRNGQRFHKTDYGW